MKKILSSICIIFFCITFCSAAFATVKEAENNYLIAQRETTELHSKLKNIYTGYEYTIKNIYTKPLQIQSINIWDNASGTVAYLSVKTGSKQAAFDTISKGASYIVPTLTLSFWGGLIAAPFSAAKNSFSNKRALNESEKYNTPQITSFELKPNETYKFKILSLSKRPPSMRIIFKNPLTDENMNLEIIR